MDVDFDKLVVNVALYLTTEVLACFATCVRSACVSLLVSVFSRNNGASHNAASNSE